MLRTKPKKTLLTLVVIFATAAEAMAQEPVAPQKAALLKELIVLMGVGKNAETIRNAMSAEFKKIRTNFAADGISGDKQLSPSQRAELQRKREELFNRIQQRVRYLMDQRINFSDVVESVVFSLYDKYFTEDELKDLVTFYKTATGKKTIQILPQLSAESMARTVERITPTMQQIMKEVIDEELRRSPDKP